MEKITIGKREKEKWDWGFK